jgi:hypothetical protein
MTSGRSFLRRADVHLDDVGTRFVLVSPDLVEELRLRQDLSGMAHQRLEQSELPRREIDLLPVETHLTRVQVKRDGPLGDLGRDRLIRTPKARMDAGQQFGEAERLREVVIRTRLQIRHPIGHRILSGEHDDGDAGASVTQQREHILAAHGGQDQIEDDDVELERPDQVQPVGSVAGGADDDALRFQPPLDEGCYPRFVLNDQHVHGHTSARTPSRGVLIPASGLFSLNLILDPEDLADKARPGKHARTCCFGLPAA